MAPPPPEAPNSGDEEDDDQEGQGSESYHSYTHGKSIGGLVGRVPPQAKDFCPEGEFLPPGQ